MTNDELEQLLKSAKVPERNNQFWENLPKIVTRRILSQSRADATAEQNESGRSKFNAVLLGLGVATACLVIGLSFGFRGGNSRATTEQLAAAQKYFREVESLFPNQLRAIVFENGEPRLVLSDKADVPASLPLFVKICSGKNCRSLITFSGQQVQINGEPIEVLSDHKGEILLVGNNFAWSSADPAAGKNQFIEAQNLKL